MKLIKKARFTRSNLAWLGVYHSFIELVILKNEFDFWNVHGITNTRLLQRK